MFKENKVGHIFELGTKYSKAMNLKVQKDNKLQDVFMGCYGIGVSRIVAAAIEQNFDDEGVMFQAISPFNYSIVLINPKSNKDLSKKNKNLPKLIKCELKFSDDRDLNPGIKLRDANLMGVPFQLVVSDRLMMIQ